MRIAPRALLTAHVAHFCAQMLLITTYFLPIKIVILLGSETAPAYLPPLLKGIDKTALIIGLSLLTVIFYALYLGAGLVASRYSRAGARALMKRCADPARFKTQLPLAARAFSRFTRGLADAVFALIVATALFCMYPFLLTISLAYCAVTVSVLIALNNRSKRVHSILSRHPITVADTFCSVGFLVTFAFIIVDFLCLTPPHLYIALIALILMRQGFSRLKVLAQDILYLRTHAPNINQMLLYPPAALNAFQIDKDCPVPRIAMIVWNEFRNDARVLKQARTLQASGYLVTVFALHTPGVTCRTEVLADGIRVIRVARSLRWRPARTQACSTSDMPAAGQSMPLRRIFSRLWVHTGLMVRLALHRAAVVHAHDVNTLPTAWLAARLSGARLVYDAHEISTSREGYAGFRKWVAGIEATLMPRAEGTITTTETRARFFARAYGIARPLVLQNRPCLKVDAPTQRIRHELGLQQPWPIILYQGGLQQGRGLERLLRVAATLKGAYVVLIGGGKLTRPLMALSEELGMTQRVHFIPTVSLVDLPSYTASADIGVQPIENTCLNHFSTDSNKLFEYVSAGLAVVATDFPEIRRIVQTHAVGLLVPAGSDQRLRVALQQLIDDTSLRRTLAKNAKNAALHLNWEQQENRLVELYQRVLAKKVEVRP